MPKQSAAPVFSKPALLDIDSTAQYVSLSPKTIRRMMTTGDFPKSRELSDRRVGWLVRELDEWAESLPIADMLPVASAK
jgi:prophage regulatory protein